MAISRSKRDIGLDLTRIIAFIQVPCIHFLFKIKYYNQAIIGERMYPMTFIRVMFMTCVPLFLLLTGYLSSEKKVEIAPKPLLKYYSRLVPILLTYVITAVITIVYGIFVNGETETIGSVIRNVLDFRKYSWYIEMYIGLALMIPFLNLLWNGIGSRKGQLSLVAVMAALTVLPSIFNIYDFKTPGALVRPWLAESFNQIVPDWWKNIYPVTYYFIGAYIRRNVDMKKLRTPALFAAYLAAILLSGVFNVWKTATVKFKYGEWCDYPSLQITVCAVLLFLFINSIRYPDVPKRASAVIAFISKITLGAYLLSWIPDNYFYRILNDAIPNIPTRLNYFPVMVALTAFTSLAAAALVQCAVNLIMLPFKKRRPPSPPDAPNAPVDSKPQPELVA